MAAHPFLSKKKTTIAFWVNILSRVYAGKGYQGNPLLMIRRDTCEDFNIAYAMMYSPIYGKLGAWASKDSVHEVSVSSSDTIAFGRWYHIAITSDNEHFAMYLNGVLQLKSVKNFETTFIEGDSVIMGRSTGKKNIRYTLATFDDICFYNRVLTPGEIKELYNEPDPNQWKAFLNEAFKYLIVIFVLVIIIIVVIARNKRKLRQQKEQYEISNKITELELKVIKAQMNPHFISNSLAAIQDLIYKKEVEEAGQYLAKFSFFLREVLDHSDKTFTTLDEEIYLIRLMVELEQKRFKNTFSFSVRIDDNLVLSDIIIPSLVTQPFIENAIWHGLLPLKDRSPVLLVHVYKKNKSIFLEISDNGVGRNKGNQQEDNKNSKGIRLSHDKIESINRLVNRIDYKLEIIDLYDENQQPFGTKIVLELTPNSQEE